MYSFISSATNWLLYRLVGVSTDPYNVDHLPCSSNSPPTVSPLIWVQYERQYRENTHHLNWNGVGGDRPVDHPGGRDERTGRPRWDGRAASDRETASSRVKPLSARLALNPHQSALSRTMSLCVGPLYPGWLLKGVSFVLMCDGWYVHRHKQCCVYAREAGRVCCATIPLCTSSICLFFFSNVVRKSHALRLGS